MSDDPSGPSLEDTFALVANETRVAILQTLWDQYTSDPHPEPKPVPFSTLRDDVGVRDPGRFHYHLDELVPQFVSRHEEGYTLTHAGGQIVGAGISGVYTDTETEFTADDVGTCANCEATLELRYERGHTIVDCGECGASYMMSVPPILVEKHPTESDPTLLGTFTMAKLRQTIRGFCFLCDGPIESHVSDETLAEDAESRDSVKVVHQCTACGAPHITDATTVVLDHPAVVSVLAEAGIDYREIPSWGPGADVESVEKLSNRDSVRVTVTITVSNESVTLELDENLTVIETR